MGEHEMSKEEVQALLEASHQRLRARMLALLDAEHERLRGELEKYFKEPDTAPPKPVDWEKLWERHEAVVAEIQRAREAGRARRTEMPRPI